MNAGTTLLVITLEIANVILLQNGDIFSPVAYRPVANHQSRYRTRQQQCLPGCGEGGGANFAFVAGGRSESCARATKGSLLAGRGGSTR